MSSYLSGSPVSSVGASSNANLNTLLSGIKWGETIGNGISMTFSFPWTSNTTALWDYGYSEPTAATHYGLNTTQQTAAIAALQTWANVANVMFTQIAETGTEVGDIRIGFSSEVADSGAWGWCYYPNSYWANGGDVWIATNMSGINMDFSRGGYAYSALIHELGHGLGLKHPGNYNGSEDGPFLAAEFDNTLYTIMSYNDPANNWWYDTQTSSWIMPFASTPMIYDIAAIQYLYGVNTNYHATDDIYTFDDSKPFLMTIWDTGGVDTISVANSTRGSLIDLNEGHFSSIQTSRFYSQNGISSTVDGSYNLGIAYGAIIENTTGGSGADTLIGNNINNTLIGNAGNDTLYGGDGDDTLNGGSGDDTMDGGTGIDTVSYASSTTGVTVNLGLTTVQNTVGSGIDTLLNIENLIGSSYNDILSGDSYNNIIDAGLGNDIVNGGGGIDTLSYATATAGVTVYLSASSAQNTGGSGIDTIKNFENITGSNYDDVLVGNVSGNVINGLAGNDFVYAGTSSASDTYDGGAGIDTISYLNATAGVTVYLSTTKAQNTGGSGIDTLIGFENITGSNYDDVLVGNVSGNVINGLAGNDIIYGGVGFDLLSGGSGND
ncbi:M10 family metallopeptidase, partial [Sulfuricurvum sp.]|uniref:M10 family metallopeptidase n=1 Tax=Sulfuricurvum sp. TaxID=2025608 RepID=UPI002D3DAB8B